MSRWPCAVRTHRVTLEQYSHCHKKMENPFVRMTQWSPSCCEHTPSHTEALINPKCSSLPAGQRLCPGWGVTMATVVFVGSKGVWMEKEVKWLQRSICVYTEADCTVTSPVFVCSSAHYLMHTSYWTEGQILRFATRDDLFLVSVAHLN